MVTNSPFIVEMGVYTSTKATSIQENTEMDANQIVRYNTVISEFFIGKPGLQCFHYNWNFAVPAIKLFFDRANQLEGFRFYMDNIYAGMTTFNLEVVFMSLADAIIWFNGQIGDAHGTISENPIQDVGEHRSFNGGAVNGKTGISYYDPDEITG